MFAEFADQNVVILGAAGFIGRWVARALTAAGARCWLVARNANAAAPIYQQFDVRGESVELDVRDFGRLRHLLRDVRPATVFNLAGYGVNRAERDPEQARLINTELVRHLADGCAEYAPTNWAGCSLVHAGSALEYGRASGSLAEDTAPLPTTLYGQTKLDGTLALSEVSSRTGLRAVTVRPFTVYGPGEDPGRLLPLLIAAQHNHDPLPLTAGLQQRDFTYVADVAEGLIRLGLSRVRTGEVVNLATGRLNSVREFVEIAAEVLQIPIAQLAFGALPTRSEEMVHDAVQTTRLEQLTGWLPRTPIADGVRYTAEFRKRDPLLSV